MRKTQRKVPGGDRIQIKILKIIPKNVIIYIYKSYIGNDTSRDNGMWEQCGFNKHHIPINQNMWFNHQESGKQPRLEGCVRHSLAWSLPKQPDILGHTIYLALNCRRVTGKGGRRSRRCERCGGRGLFLLYINNVKKSQYIVSRRHGHVTSARRIDYVNIRIQKHLVEFPAQMWINQELLGSIQRALNNSYLLDFLLERLG